MRNIENFKFIYMCINILIVEKRNNILTYLYIMVKHTEANAKANTNHYYNCVCNVN